VISESRYLGEDKEWERSRIVVFPDHAQDFLEVTLEMVKRLV
jgi:hypothetical protein